MVVVVFLSSNPSFVETSILCLYVLCLCRGKHFRSILGLFLKGEHVLKKKKGGTIQDVMKIPVGVLK